MPLAHNPDSMAAFIHFNGPVQGGIDASIFDHTDEHWVKWDVCNRSTHHINHGACCVRGRI